MAWAIADEFVTILRNTTVRMTFDVCDPTAPLIGSVHDTSLTDLFKDATADLKKFIKETLRKEVVGSCVQRLYAASLCRQADESGLESYVSQLLTGKVSKERIEEVFAECHERKEIEGVLDECCFVNDLKEAKADESSVDFGASPVFLSRKGSAVFRTKDGASTSASIDREVVGTSWKYVPSSLWSAIERCGGEDESSISSIIFVTQPIDLFPEAIKADKGRKRTIGTLPWNVLNDMEWISRVLQIPVWIRVEYGLSSSSFFDREEIERWMVRVWKRKLVDGIRDFGEYSAKFRTELVRTPTTSNFKIARKLVPSPSPSSTESTVQDVAAVVLCNAEIDACRSFFSELESKRFIEDFTLVVAVDSEEVFDQVSEFREKNKAREVVILRFPSTFGYKLAANLAMRRATSFNEYVIFLDASVSVSNDFFVFHRWAREMARVKNDVVATRSVARRDLGMRSSAPTAWVADCEKSAAFKNVDHLTILGSGLWMNRVGKSFFAPELYMDKDHFVIEPSISRSEVVRERTQCEFIDLDACCPGNTLMFHERKGKVTACDSSSFRIVST